MKKLLIGFLVLGSLQVLAGEISATKCSAFIDAYSGKVFLTNNIEKDAYFVNRNCLDLVKEAADTEIEGVKLSGVLLDYTNP